MPHHAIGIATGGLVALPVAGAAAATAAYQVGEVLRSVEGEGDPDTWALKIITLLCVSALGWLGKKLYESPRAAEVDALRKEADRLEDRLSEMETRCQDLRDRAYAAERRADMAELRSQIGGAGIADGGGA